MHHSWVLRVGVHWNSISAGFTSVEEESNRNAYKVAIKGTLMYRKRRFTKTMLLPIPTSVAQMRSMRAHLALASLECGHGNGDLAAELIRSIYITWFLVSDGPDVEADLFTAAEAGMQRCLDNVVVEKCWRVDEPGARVLGRVLCLLDQELDAAPSHLVLSAVERFEESVLSGVMPSVADMLRRTRASCLESTGGRSAGCADGRICLP